MLQVIALFIGPLFGFCGLCVGGWLTYSAKRNETRAEEERHRLKVELEARDKSGSVATTSAEKLWESYTVLLNAYVNENGTLRTRVSELESRAHASELKEADCDRRNLELTATVAQLQTQVESLRRSLVDTATVAIDHEKEGM